MRGRRQSAWPAVTGWWQAWPRSSGRVEAWQTGEGRQFGPLLPPHPPLGAAASPGLLYPPLLQASSTRQSGPGPSRGLFHSGRRYVWNDSGGDDTCDGDTRYVTTACNREATRHVQQQCDTWRSSVSCWWAYRQIVRVHGFTIGSIVYCIIPRRAKELTPLDFWRPLGINYAHCAFLYQAI